jgi:outer membrane protein assembly factor BamB
MKEFVSALERALPTRRGRTERAFRDRAKRGKMFGLYAYEPVRQVFRWGTLIALVACLLGLTGCNPYSVYGPLARQWAATIPSEIASKAAVAQGSVYVGGFSNGYEYSFDETAGTLNWQTNLGTTTDACPTPETDGVVSSPTVLNGSAYLGGGDANWYALSTSSGTVQWSFPVGDNSPTGGNFNWSSPLVYNGFAYVGVASLCDSPLVQGKLLRVDLGTHQISNVWKAVPDGQVGVSIWTNPVVDPSTNTIFVTTGNRSQASQQYGESIVGLDATTLAVRGSWSANVSGANDDFDFGASPTLFTDALGRQLVGAVNKNGVFYALDRNNLNAGPVWQTQIAQGGSCPTCGDGSVSTAYFDGQRLYVAGGNTIIDGQAYAGSVRAIDPTSGRVLWAVGLDKVVIGGLVGQNGMVAVPELSGLYVLEGASGKTLYANDLGYSIFATPTLADGHLIIGTVDGVVHTLAFPAQVPAAHSTTARIATLRGLIPRNAPRCFSGGTCRLTASPRCSVLRTPGSGPTIRFESLKARVLGRTRSHDFVRVYGNGTCMGRPLLQLPLGTGSANFQVDAPVSLPLGATIGVSAPRSLRLRVDVLTHPAHEARHPQPFPSRVPAFYYGSRR